MPRKTLSFFDVFGFVAGYCRCQPVKLPVILFMFVVSAGLESYLPTALSAFLGAVRQQAEHATIIIRLSVFLGIYFIQAALYMVSFFIYNSFETKTFQAVMDDAFYHVHELSEHFFVN